MLDEHSFRPCWKQQADRSRGSQQGKPPGPAQPLIAAGRMAVERSLLTSCYTGFNHEDVTHLSRSCDWNGTLVSLGLQARWCMGYRPSPGITAGTSWQLCPATLILNSSGGQNKALQLKIHAVLLITLLAHSTNEIACLRTKTWEDISAMQKLGSSLS